MGDFINNLPSLNEVFDFLLSYWYAIGGTASMIAIVIYGFKLLTLRAVNRQNKTIFDRVLDKVIVDLWGKFESLLIKKTEDLENNNNLSVEMLKNELKDLKSKSEAFTKTILEQNNELKSSYEKSLLQVKSYEEKTKVLLSQKTEDTKEIVEDKKEEIKEVLDHNKSTIEKEAKKISKDLDKKIKKVESGVKKNEISLD